MRKWLEKKIKRRLPSEIKRNLKALYPGKDEEVLVQEFCIKKLRLLGMVLLIGVSISILLFCVAKNNARISESGEIAREDSTGKDISVPVTIHSEDYDEIQMDIVVGKQSYTEEQLETLFYQAEIWLAETMVGNNESLQCVREDLMFPSAYEDTEIVIAYSTDNYGLIRENGEVLNRELEKEETVVVKACFSYGDVIKECSYTVVVYPVLLTPQEEFRRRLETILLEEDSKQSTTDKFKLPTLIGEEWVEYREQRDRTPFYGLLLTILCGVLLYQGMDKDVEKLYAERQKKLRLAYPEFVSSLALLVGAGMSVSGAIRRVYEDKRTEPSTPLTEELGIFVRNLDNGVLVEQALEDLGKRSGLVPYRKFCSLLTIHMKKGSVNLQTMLEKESEEAFEEQQLQIRQLGEEAGTKLLLPMILMLAVVMVIIMVPAFLSYQIN